MSDRKDGSAKFTYLHTDADEAFNNLMNQPEISEQLPKEVARVVFNTDLVQQVRIDAPRATELVAQIPLDQHLSSAS